MNNANDLNAFLDEVWVILVPQLKHPNILIRALKILRATPLHNDMNSCQIISESFLERSSI